MRIRSRVNGGDADTSSIKGPISKAKAHASIYLRALQQMQRPQPDLGLTVSLLLRSAERGNADAIYALASWRLYGKAGYVRRNWREAVRLLKIAASGGVASAMFDLAICFERGNGTKEDPSTAYAWYVWAAVHEDRQAVYEVARCQYWGIGTERNRKAAAAGFMYAAKLGITS